MSAYTKTTNFTAKDALISGNPSKIVKGSEIDDEFTAIETAVNSKANQASPVITGSISLNGVVITSTAAELNILDGVTATAAEINVLDGITSTVSELNILDGVTSTAAELNILDGVTATTAELNYVAGVTSSIQTQMNLKAPLTNAVLVTPNLGTPSAGTLTNATGLPIVAGTTGTLSQARGGTGVTTASNGQLLIGNGSGFTAATLTAGTGVTLTNGAGSVSIAFSGPGAGDALTTNPLSQFAATTSSQLAGVISDETGSGALVFATSPALITPALGTPASGVLSSCTVDGTDAVGFRNIPISSKSAAYTTVLADSGKVIFHPSTDANARTFTIDSNANVAYALGTALTFINMTSQVVTIAITSDTMYLSSAGTTGSRSLAQYGSATAIKITSTTWLISGSGLT